MFDDSTVNRFWDKVDVRDENECWEWLGCLDNKSYGQFKVDGRWWGAHRYSYEINVGPIQNDLCVLHRCDNPSCVNPEHLWLGTRVDNNRDMCEKGRQRGGSGHPKVLTDEQVDEIRRKYTTDLYTYRQLGVEYGVDKTLIWRVINYGGVYTS